MAKNQLPTPGVLKALLTFPTVFFLLVTIVGALRVEWYGAIGFVFFLTGLMLEIGLLNLSDGKLNS